MRSEPLHFTHSKMMCWVALDRALRLCDAGHVPSGHAATWRREAARDPRVHRDALLVASDWAATPAHAGGEELDASLLLGVLLGYGAEDPGRLAATVTVLQRDLGRGPLVHRYSGEDGLRGAEGAFLCCSFWLADALARIGRVDEATELMRAARSRSPTTSASTPRRSTLTPTSCWATSRRASSHLALINAAVSIAEASDR